MSSMLAALKILQRSKLEQKAFNPKPLSKLNRLSIQPETGFTLIELLVVVVMVGVLATIAAPSWLTFLNQRRASAVNDVIFRSLQEAQSEAKKTKRSYDVSFRTPAGKLPEISVHPTGSPERWKSIGEDLGAIKLGQVTLGTYLSGDPTTPINTTSPGAQYSFPTARTIRFDYTGGLPPQPPPNLGTKGLIVMTAVPKGSSTDPIPSTVRCVKVTTLLGSIQTGKTTECVP